MDEEFDFLPQKNIYCVTLHNMKVENDKRNITKTQKNLNCCETNAIENLSRMIFFRIEE